jgi:hypothetical protein
MEAAYEDIINWLAKLNPEEVIAYAPSEASLERVQGLLLKQSADTLTAEEKEELFHYVFLENMLGLAKARAYQLLRA